MDQEEWDLDITFPPATMGYKRKSDEVATTNNLSKWWKQSKTRIKNNFQSELKEWYLPLNTGKSHRWAEIHFTILRKNKRKIDSDSMGPSTYKWAIDALVHQKWLSDDDQCKIVLNPTQLDVPSSVETQVRMQVKFKD